MKNIAYLLLGTALFFWASCEEIAPEVTPIMEVDSVCDTPEPIEGQARQVLIEEFTGVRCVNCPAGSEALKGLLETYGVQLVAVSIHAGSFSPPYPESYDTLRTQQGENILSLLGEPLGYPTAVVNRTSFNNGISMQLGRGSWAGAIEEVLATGPPMVAIGIRTQFDEGGDELSACITLDFKETIDAEDVRLSVFLTENNVVDLQLTPASSEPDPNYVHEHVFRTALTNYAGNLITEEMTAGNIIQQTFAIPFLEKWKAEDCHVIAFVHYGGDNKVVLQAAEAEVL
jgi:hypothetical protein